MSSGEITAAEMAALDENCKAFGLSTLQLMENAGSAVAKEIARRFKARGVLVLAGKGNNGGDGFRLTRHSFEACAEYRINNDVCICQ